MAGSTLTFNSVTIGDDANKLFIQVEQLGRQALVQIEPLFRATNPAQFPRGNVGGQFVATCAKSHADRATAVAYFKTEQAKINTQASLVLNRDGTTVTMAGAILVDVTVALWIGVFLMLRYRWAVTTMA